MKKQSLGICDTEDDLDRADRESSQSELNNSDWVCEDGDSDYCAFEEFMQCTCRDMDKNDMMNPQRQRIATIFNKNRYT